MPLPLALFFVSRSWICVCMWSSWISDVNYDQSWAIDIIHLCYWVEIDKWQRSKKWVWQGSPGRLLFTLKRNTEVNPVTASEYYYLHVIPGNTAKVCRSWKESAWRESEQVRFGSRERCSGSEPTENHPANVHLLILHHIHHVCHGHLTSLICS